MANLYDAINDKLEKVNCVQIQRGTDITAYALNKERYRWESRRNGVVTVQATYQLTAMLADLPHESRIKGTMLVVTAINPEVRAE